MGNSPDQRMDVLLDEVAATSDALTALVAVTDEGFRELVHAFSGTKSIAGRDGEPGPPGPRGRDGESIVTFRTGYDSRTAPSADGLAVFRGHAVHLTPENAAGWWIERLPYQPAASWYVTVVELPEGVQSGRLRWAERETYTYRRSESATLGARRTLAEVVLREPEVYVAAAADAGLPGDSIPILRDLIARWPVSFAATLETGGHEPEASAKAAELTINNPPPGMPWLAAMSLQERADLLVRVRAHYAQQFASR